MVEFHRKPRQHPPEVSLRQHINPESVHPGILPCRVQYGIHNSRKTRLPRKVNLLRNDRIFIVSRLHHIKNILFSNDLSHNLPFYFGKRPQITQNPCEIAGEVGNATRKIAGEMSKTRNKIAGDFGTKNVTY